MKTQHVISLESWLNINARRPLLAIGALAVALWSGIFAFLYFEFSKQQTLNTKNLADVLSIAVAQKNRPLIESLLQSQQTQLNASSVAVCDGSLAIISNGLRTNPCIGSSNTFETIFSNEIPGHPSYRLEMVFGVLDLGAGKSFYLALSGLFIVAILSLLATVLLKFRREVVSPLQVGLLGDRPLRIKEFESIRTTTQQTQIAKTQAAVADAVMAVARQVSHDIRSPVSALNALLYSLDGVSADKREFIKSIADRINGIANSLLTGEALNLARQQSQETSVETNFSYSIAEVVSSVVQEKQTLYGPKVQFDVLTPEGDHSTDATKAECFRPSTGVSAPLGISKSDLSRVISNLIENSVEATSAASKPGRIQVEYKSEPDKLTLSVSDNGVGMPADLVSRLGQVGLTSGKSGESSGFGLGVAHAMRTVHNAGGSLSYSSTIGTGTTALIQLPHRTV